MTSNKRIKVLFVTRGFLQAGAERCLYETCRALNPKHYQVEILTKRRIHKDDYYYHRLIELGIPVHTRLITRRYLESRYPYLAQRFPIVDRLLQWCYDRIEWKLPRFLEGFDIVDVFMISNYKRLVAYNEKNLVVHLLSNSIQYYYQDIYQVMKPDHKYRFVTMNITQQDEVIQSRGKKDTFLNLPLPIDFSTMNELAIDQLPFQPLKIGVFSRIGTEKNIEPLLFSFHSIRQKLRVSLHIYGFGDPSIYDRTIKLLHLEDDVFFEGHREDMNHAIVNDGLSLSWLGSVEESIGYSSIEIAGVGLPMVFWNLGYESYEEILSRTDGRMHSFNNVYDFADFTIKILQSAELLQDIAYQLRDYVRQQYGIRRNIKDLEALYDDIVRENAKVAVNH